jgi:hypothetical protein
VGGLSILWEPGAVFASVRDDPRRRWLAPLLIVVLVGAAASTFHFLRMDVGAQLLEQMAANIPEGQEAAIEKMEGMIGVIAGFTIAMAYVGPIGWLLALGFAAWLMGKILGGTGTFAQGLAVAALAQMPQAYAGLLTVPVAALRSAPPGLQDLQSLLRVHAAAFSGLPPTDPLFVLSAAFGLFSLWSLGLAIVGTSIVFDVKPWKAGLGWGLLKIASAAMAVGGAMAGAAAGGAS